MFQGHGCDRGAPSPGNQKQLKMESIGRRLQVPPSRPAGGGYRSTLGIEWAPGVLHVLAEFGSLK